MKHILITTQVFPPETHPTAVMVDELARHLSGRGFGVTVAAGLPHHPSGKLPEGFERALWRRERRSGYEVLRAGHLVSESRTIPARLAVYATQALATALAGAVARKVDLVLVYGPPLVGPALGAALARRHRAPMVNVIYDVYPDIAVETGKVRSPALIAAARLFERLQYREAAATLVLSRGLKQLLVDRGVPPERVVVLPIWLDADEITPGPRDNAWRHEQGIPLDKTVFLYAGTIGVISEAPVVAEAAAMLRDRPDILFLFVGEGEAKQAVKERAEALGLTNLRLLPFQPRQRLAEVQRTADVGVVTLQPGRAKTSVPSKVLGYMAAGRPVLAAVDADSDTALQVAPVGIVTPPSDPAALAAAARRMADDAASRRRWGEAARQAFVKEYARAEVLERYERLLDNLAAGARA